ncbi:MAG TPA: hypothetical protein VMA74_20440 [Dyella sp.]|uniref:hypothetical protein n=1 Tax=Dyella sp. TaxID=1869338 RepID=UPI002BCC9754|nr:hypothetical protein [Dyella sp.]HUB92104.1 hypothetical protein [Dyella sp.]
MATYTEESLKSLVPGKVYVIETQNLGTSFTKVYFKSVFAGRFNYTDMNFKDRSIELSELTYIVPGG